MSGRDRNWIKESAGIVLVVLGISSQVLGQTTFTEVASSAGVADPRGTKYSFTTAWGDYDNDGDQDLAVGNQYDLQFYQNNGNGTFSNVTTAAGLSGYEVTAGTVFGDYDNDGDLDLYTGIWGGAPKLWRNNGNGTFTDVAAAAGVTPGNSMVNANFVDYNTDGFIDLFLSSNSATPALYRSNQNGTFTEVMITSGLPTASYHPTFADYDNDGDPDAFVGTPSALLLYQNNGNGIFSNVTAASGLPPSSYPYPYGVVEDFDNDGDLDLFVMPEGGGSGACYLYRNNGNGTFTDITSVAGISHNVTGGSRAIGADFDNNGGIDIYVMEATDSGMRANAILWNNGNGTFTKTTGDLSTGNVFTCSASDYDNDGDVDVYVGVNGAPNLLYRNNGNANRWLQVKLAGTASNKAGIGARVRVVAGGVAQSREVRGGEGSKSMGSLPVEFGFGSTSTVDSLIIRWPSGIVQVQTNVATNQLLTVTEQATPPALQFTEVGASAGVNSPIGAGVAAGDFNNDGYIDFYVNRVYDPPLLYRNNGNGTFTEVGVSAGVSDNGSGGVAWADYDNDGDLDVFHVNFSYAPYDRLYRNEGNGTFTEVGGSAGVRGSGGGRMPVWGDYDNDGDVDLFVVTSNLDRLYRNEGNGTFTEVGASAGVNDSGDGRAAAWGDYDGDRDLDLYVSNAGGTPNRLYRNEGNGAFTEVGASAGVNYSTWGAGVAWGDYDNDQDLDLYLVNHREAPNRLYRNNGNGTFTEIGASAGVNDTGTSEGITWVDYDSDGDLDIYLSKGGGSPSENVNRLYRNNDDGTFTEVAASVGVNESGSTRGTSWADYDNDGDLDLFLTNENIDGNPPNRLYKNNGTANRWLNVKLAGQVSNRAAIGTQVISVTGSRRQRRDVDGGSGWWSQSSLPVEFGFGSTSTVDSLIVRWPSGNVQVLTNVATNQLLTVAEATPTILLSSTSVSVGNVNVGSSGTATFTVGNTGSAALSVMGITVGGTDGAQFTVSPTSFTVNAGAAAQTITVTFTPSSPGAKSALLSLAHNASGTPSSVALTGTGQDVIPPAVPSTPMAVAGNNQITLTWIPNPESDLSHYALYRSTTDNFTPGSADSIAQVNKPTTTYTNTGLAPATYYYKLAAVDSANNKSPVSTQASATITILLKANDPNPPTLRFTGSGSLVVSVSDSGNTSLSVTPSITGTDAAQFSVSPNVVTTVSPGATQSFSVTFTPSSSTGSNRSATLNLVHNATNKTSPLAVALVGDVPPNAPAGAAGTANGMQVTLSWTANTEADIAYYVVYRSTIDNFTPAGTDSISRVDKSLATFTNTGLEPGTYSYRLVAVDGAGNRSSASAQVRVFIDVPYWEMSAVHGERLSPSAGPWTWGDSTTASIDGTVQHLSGATWGAYLLISSYWQAERFYDLSYTASNTGFSANEPGPRIGGAVLRYLDGNNLIGVQGSIDGQGLTFWPFVVVGGDHMVALPTVLQQQWLAMPSRVDQTIEVRVEARENVYRVYVRGGSVVRDSLVLAFRDEGGHFVTSRRVGLMLYPSDYYLRHANQWRNVAARPVISLVLLKANDPVPSSLAFKGSSSQTVTVSDSGNTNLTVTPTITGADAAQFSVSPNTATTVAPGATQSFTVSFNASSLIGNYRTAILNLAHNATNKPNPLTVTLTGDVPPNTPSGLAASAGNAQVVLTWTANTETDLSHYVVYRSTTNNFNPATSDSIARVSKPTISYTNTGLGAATYYFKLAAVDSAGNKSPFSAQASAAVTVLVKTGDPTPSSLTFKGSASSALAVAVSDSGNTSLTVTPTITGPDAAQFSVSPNAATTVLPGAAQSFTVTFNPSPATGSNRSATLNLAHNATNKTSPLNVSLIGDVPPNAPAGLTALPGNSQATLSWTANSESDLSYYVVYRITNTSAQGDSVARVNQPATSFTHTGLIAGIYYYKLKAVDTGGNQSGESNPVQAIIAPVIVVSQTALSFGGVQVNTSKTLTFTVSNSGTAALSVSAVALSGPSGSFSATPSSLNINPGEAARTVTLTYTPAAARKDTAFLTLSHNAAPTATSTTVTLTGEGSSIPVPVPSPNPLVFGNVKVGQSKAMTLTVSNASLSAISVSGIVSNDPAFTVSPASLSLPASGNATATVTFTPTDRNAHNATLTLTYATTTGTAPVTTSLTGQGLQPEIVASPPDSLRFGEVKPGQRKELSLTLTNPGNDTLLVSAITSSNSVFSVPSSPLTLLAGASRLLSVSYAPSASRVDTGTMTISSNAANLRNLKLGLVGRGAETASIDLRPSALNFGNVKVDSARVGIVRVRNAGGDTLKVTELKGLQPPFSAATPQVSSLLAGDSTLVRVRFAPTARGIFTDTLVINSNGGVRELAVSGRGTRAELSVPERLVFDPVPLGTTGELNMILKNVGDDTLQVTNLLSGKPQRFQVGSTSLVIPPNNAQGVSVRFTPTAAGKDSTDLTLSTTVGIKAVRVVGSTTVVGVVTLSPDTLRLGPAAIGTTATGSVELRNDQGDTLRVSQLTVSPAVFKLARSTSRLRVAPGAVVQISLTFKPVATDTVLGALQVRSDAPGSPHRVVLIGLPEPPPRIALSPADTLRFGVVGPGQSQLIPLTIRNNGGGVLKVVLRSESEEFVPQQIDTVRIGTSQQQNVQVRFQPARTGTRTANLQIWANDPQIPLSALVMQGIGGGLRFEPVSIDFGPVLVGTAKDTTVTLINETANALTLTLDLFGAGFSADPRAAIRIDAGKRVQVQVRFEPNAEGEYSAKLEVRDRNVFLELFGKGVEVKVRPPTGLAAARGSDRVTLTWNANTEVGLSYYVIYRSQQENFEPVATDSLGRTSRTVTRFTDRKLPAGTSYYRLVAVDRAGNRSEASEPVAVTMTSTLPTVAPDRLDFGQVAVGTPKTLSVVVTNPGISTLSLTSLTLTGRDAQQFAATSTLPLAVSAGSSATLSVVFNPTASGAKTALLNIAHDRGAPLTVALSGIATAPAGGSLQVSPSSLIMDNTPARTTSRKTLRLSNPGSSEVKVTLRLGGRNANQFKVTPSQATVRAGRAQSLIVTFAPTSAGTKSATLTIIPSTGSPLTVALSGKATAGTAAGLSAGQEAAKPLGVVDIPFGLGENYPNPFNAQTLIHYQLAQAGPVRLAIYDMLGQQVVVLMNGVQGEGRYQVTWDGRDQRGKAVASGIYFYRIETGSFRAVRKLLLVR